MTAPSPPSAEPEAVRIARRMLTEQWHGQDTVELAEHILRDHEQRERAREGMDEAAREGDDAAMKLARNVVDHCTGAAFAKALNEPEACNCNRCVLSRALLAAAERIAALEAEVGRVSAERDAEYQDAIRAERAQDRLEISLDVLRSRLAGLLWRVKRERDEARTSRDRFMREWGEQVDAGLEVLSQRDSAPAELDRWRSLGTDLVQGAMLAATGRDVNAANKERDEARAEVEALRAERDAHVAFMKPELDRVARLVEKLQGERDEARAALTTERAAANQSIADLFDERKALRAVAVEALDMACPHTQPERDRVAALRQLATKGTP